MISCIKITNIILWLKKPLEKRLHFLLLIFFLLATIGVYDSIKNGLLNYAFYIALFEILTSYVLCLFTENLPFKWRKLFRFLLLLIAFSYTILNVICEQIYDQPFNYKFAPILMQTNLSEALEFLESYINLKIIIVIISISFSIILFIKYVKKVSIFQNRFTQNIVLFIITISFILCIRNPLVYKDSFIGKMIAVIQTSSVPNLKEYQTNTKIVTLGEKTKNIVMIIGESFSKSHSSLYGYEKKTNPQLSSLVEDGSLFVYNNITSPATSTIPSIQSIMSTYNSHYHNNIPWYKCVTLPYILHIAGYYTYWISNQSKIGLFDTVTGRYSDLCKESYYVGNKFSGMSRTTLDEEILPILDTLLIENKNSYNFYFIHLMGSHSNFKKRYPLSFNKFSEYDYEKYPKHQRENLASYDNSILYNDSIVNEIIQKFHDKEAIIFYFSDHGIDAYESSSDHIGHAKENDNKSVEFGKRIPFVIYTSPCYKYKYPYKINQIINNLNQPYCTEDIIHSIMDLIDTKFINQFWEGKSLFSNKTHIKSELN